MSKASMATFKNYYTILNVSGTATHMEIKAAYVQCCKKYHPDLNPGIDTTIKMQDVNEAKDVLLDPVKRANFDYQLNIHDNASNQHYAHHNANNNSSQESSIYAPDYIELLGRLDTLKEKNVLLYYKYMNQVGALSTDEILYTINNRSRYSQHQIDISIFILHEYRSYSIDLVYAQLNQKPDLVAIVRRKFQQIPWWGVWLFIMLLRLMLKG